MDGRTQEAYLYLVNLADERGYVTFEEIIDSADKWNLSIQDVDWLSNSVTTRGVLVYDEAPSSINSIDSDEYDDFAQGDYEAVFARVIELDESLTMYIENVRKLVPPQARELSRLKYQVKDGNEHARNRMIEMHLRLAVKIALQRAEAMDFDIIDAIGCANIGLMQAIEKFDPDINGAFSGYASFWMYQVMSRMQPTKRPHVYYPVHKKENFFAMYSDLKRQGCFECDKIDQCNNIRNMICEKLECGLEQAEDVVLASIPFEPYDVIEIFTYDMEDFENYDSDLSIACSSKSNDYITSNLHIFSEFSLDNNIESMLLKRILINILSEKLSDKEKQVLLMRHGFIQGEEMTLDEVGKIFGVTRERIRQIEAKALKKLQQPKVLERLKDFWWSVN